MRRCSMLSFITLLAIAVVAPGVAQSKTTSPIEYSGQQAIMGWVEYVYLQDLNGRLKAKLDTGATTSSMRAEVMNVMEKGKRANHSVIFQITDADGKVTTLERKLVRWVRIKSKSGTLLRRPVVEMDFCIAGRPITSEVNLAPRKDFVYPILVGRNMLRAANIIVDSNKIFSAHARCPNLTSKDE